MSLAIASKIAARELKGGLNGFRIFLLCLALGVSAIAAVGTVRSAIQAGLDNESAALLGGDAELQFTYRFANETEQQWIADNTSQASEIVDFRSMVNHDPTRQSALTQVKGIDAFYPLYGTITLSPEMDLQTALETRNGLPGLIAAPSLIDRLQVTYGDILRLGAQEFELRATLVSEPDSGAAGFRLGPRVMVKTTDLAQSGLLAEGTLFESRFRLRLPPSTDLAALEAEALEKFANGGIRWRDRRNATPGISDFVDRMSLFLVLVGLAGMAVGGVGVAAAVRSYLEQKTETIATLKSLGATRGIIFTVYLMQIGVLSLIGIALGLLIGGGLPTLLTPLLAEQLPIPVQSGFYPGPLFEAAIYGILTALIFSIWPLARAVEISAAGLFRDISSHSRQLPRPRYLMLIALLSVLMFISAAIFSDAVWLTFWSGFGILVALVALWLAAVLTRRIAARLSRSRLTKTRPALRWALAAVGGPGGETASVILSLGLGLTVLATIGQIDTNLRTVISQELPARAPAFFVLDIQTDQLDSFRETLSVEPGVNKIETAPMLRGNITRINGVPAKEVVGDHWIISGSRGVSYFAEPPESNRIVKGSWWPNDYTGPPLMSFSQNEAEEIGLQLGDEITVNILGRDLTAKINSFHAVEFSDMSMNFIMIWNPTALQNAPHSHLATLYAEPGSEGNLTRIMADNFPNITAIEIREAVTHITGTLDKLASAIRWGAGATLLTGIVVLIGAAAAGENRRIFEAAILKTLGATRRRILGSFALRSLILGAAAGGVAILAGSVFGWAVLTFVMEATFQFNWLSAFAIITGGALASLVTGLFFAWRPLSTQPARILRNRS
ncbi:MAG: FtsX-like permease family protein [Rhodobacteraceae bacterium]|nr:FtsX-like permease family protein [Paracoccaceae bacterium]